MIERGWQWCLARGLTRLEGCAYTMRKYLGRCHTVVSQGTWRDETEMVVAGRECDLFDGAGSGYGSVPEADPQPGLRYSRDRRSRRRCGVGQCGDGQPLGRGGRHRLAPDGGPTHPKTR